MKILDTLELKSSKIKLGSNVLELPKKDGVIAMLGDLSNSEQDVVFGDLEAGVISANCGVFSGIVSAREICIGDKPVATKEYVDTCISTLEGEVQEAVNELSAKVSSVYKYVGSVETEEALKALDTTNLNNGDVYNVTATDENWALIKTETETKWDKLGSTIDLAPYALKTDVSGCIAEVEAKIPDVSNFLSYTTENSPDGFSGKVIEGPLKIEHEGLSFELLNGILSFKNSDGGIISSINCGGRYCAHTLTTKEYVDNAIKCCAITTRKDYWGVDFVESNAIVFGCTGDPSNPGSVEFDGSTKFKTIPTYTGNDDVVIDDSGCGKNTPVFVTDDAVIKYVGEKIEDVEDKIPTNYLPATFESGEYIVDYELHVKGGVITSVVCGVDKLRVDNIYSDTEDGDISFNSPIKVSSIKTIPAYTGSDDIVINDSGCGDYDEGSGDTPIFVTDKAVVKYIREKIEDVEDKIPTDYLPAVKNDIGCFIIDNGIDGIIFKGCVFIGQGLTNSEVGAEFGGATNFHGEAWFQDRVALDKDPQQDNEATHKKYVDDAVKCVEDKIPTDYLKFTFGSSTGDLCRAFVKQSNIVFGCAFATCSDSNSVVFGKTDVVFCNIPTYTGYNDIVINDSGCGDPIFVTDEAVVKYVEDNFLKIAHKGEFGNTYLSGCISFNGPVSFTNNTRPTSFYGLCANDIYGCHITGLCASFDFLTVNGYSVSTTCYVDDVVSSVKDYVDDKISLIGSAFNFKGNSTYEDLPSNSQVGDVYNLTQDYSYVENCTIVTPYKRGDNLAWTCDGWVKLENSVALSEYYDKSEVDACVKTATDAVSALCSAVDTKLDGKADKSTTYTKTEVDTALEGYLPVESGCNNAYSYNSENKALRFYNGDGEVMRLCGAGHVVFPVLPESEQETPTSGTHLTPKSYVDAQVKTATDAITTLSGCVYTKTEVDTALEGYLPVNGMCWMIDKGGYLVHSAISFTTSIPLTYESPVSKEGLLTPTDDGHLTNKKYVDDLVSTSTSTANSNIVYDEDFVLGDGTFDVSTSQMKWTVSPEGATKILSVIALDGEGNLVHPSYKWANSTLTVSIFAKSEQDNPGYTITVSYKK